MVILTRHTFCRYKHAIEEGGIEALLDTNRRLPIDNNLLVRILMNAPVR